VFGLGVLKFVVGGAVLAVIVVIGVFYLLSLQKALTLCSAEARTLTPGLVWLLLIPLFSLVWHFFVVNAISKSLHREYVLRGMNEEPEPGKGIGLAMCILSAVSIVPFLGGISCLAAIPCWIVYWVKIAGHSAKLRAPVAVRV
jgi:hypothetical protein